MSEARRILLVEDNASDVELTLAALEAHGLARQVAVARDAGEALEYLQRHGTQSARAPALPAALLLDIKLPQRGGLELLRTMKSDPLLRLIPVIMLTSSREEQDVRRSYELSANAYVVKPVDFARFAETLRQVVTFWGDTNEPPLGTLPRQP